MDVFLCCWMVPQGFYMFLDQVIGRSRTPYVLWALGSDVNKYKSNPLFRTALRLVTAGAGLVYADGYKLCEDVTNVTGRDCEFLPTFRELRSRSPRTRSPGASKRFLFVGRHAQVKGIDVLVDALLALKSMNAPAYEFRIVGDGEMTAGLRDKVERAGLGSLVHWAGRVSEGDLEHEYARADCVVIPSRSESIPVVMSEALQNGVPLIVTDVGDMGSLARRYRLGEVVPPEDARALAACMRRFMDSPWQLDEHSTAQLLGELTFERASHKLLEKLEGLVAASRT